MICLRNALCVLAAWGSLAPLVASAYTNPTPQRSYVSIHGVDGNTCGFEAPCRTWQYAMDNETQPGGEVLTIDSGGFGTLNITKDITIVVPPGVYGGMSPPAGTAGITINAPASAVVLRGLTIQSQGSGNYGIQMTSGTSLTMENCTISSFSTGLSVTGSTDTRILNSIFRDNSWGVGIYDGGTASISRSQFFGNAVAAVVQANTTATASVLTIERSFAKGGSQGFLAYTVAANATTRLNVINSGATRNSAFGIGAYTTGLAGQIAEGSVSNSLITENNEGLVTQSAGAKLVVGGNTVTHNTYGLLVGFSSVIESAGNNTVRNNTTDVSGSIPTFGNM